MSIPEHNQLCSVGYEFLALRTPEGDIYIYKNGERLWAEGNFKEGNRPAIGWVYGAKTTTINANEYIVVSTLCFTFFTSWLLFSPSLFL